MFETLQAAPADAILGLITEHKNDPRPNKIDLGVGVFRTAEGETPVLDVVKQAEQRILDTQESKAYIGTARIPSGSLGRIRRAVESDDTFRSALAKGAVPELVDEVVEGTDEVAIETTRQLGRDLGLLVGISSGANV